MTHLLLLKCLPWAFTMASTHPLKDATDLDDILIRHGSPLLLDSNLEVIHIALRLSTGLSLDVAPDAIGQRWAIWWGRRQHCAGPEGGKLTFAPLLNNFGTMCWCRVLLPDVVTPGVVLIQPGLHHILHDAQVLFSPNLEAFLEPVGRHSLTIRADDPKHHCWLRVLGDIDGQDLLLMKCQASVIPGILGLVRSLVLLVKEDQDSGLSLLLEEADDPLPPLDPFLLAIDC